MRSLAGKVWRRLQTEPKIPNQYPDWQSLLKKDDELWKTARAKANGPLVLIATSAGGFVPGAIVESTLAVALTLRGAQVHILLCDELLPGCIQGMLHTTDPEEYAKYGPQRRLCDSCFPPGNKMYQALGLPVHRFSELVTTEEQLAARHLSAEIPYSDIGNYKLDELAVGEHALAGALRFFARGELDGEPHAEIILRRYFNAALLTTYMTRRLLRSYPFASACFHHGIYVPQELIGQVARQEEVRVVNWNPTALGFHALDGASLAAQILQAA